MEYSEDYIRWKGWHNFGKLDNISRLYFDAELKRVGLKSIDTVFEVGFGEGKFLSYAKARGWNVLGCELNSYLTQKACEAGFGVVEGLEGIPENSQDLIVAFDVLEHIPPEKLEGFLALVKSRLKSGGLFLTRFPNGDSPLALRNQNADPTHLNFIGSGKALYYSKILDFPIVSYGPPTAPLFCGDWKLFFYRLYATPVKWLVEFFIRAIFFPKTKVSWTSPNLVVVWQKR